MKTLLNSLVIVSLLMGCTPPNYYEHRSAMFADQAYQQNGLPQIYILGVDENDADVERCEFKINDSYWTRMDSIPSQQTTGYPSGYNLYYKSVVSNFDEDVNSVEYLYRCEYEIRTWMGIRNSDSTYPDTGFFTIEKPIWLSWKEESATQWNPSYNENLANNVIIENEGCYDPVHLQNPALRLRTIESYFSIRNDANYPLYITPFPTIIDLNTGQVTEHGDYFSIQPLGSPSYSNNNIMLNQNEEVQFRLDYHVTVAGMGPIVDSIKIHFLFGESATDLNRNFDIGANLRFEFAGVGNLCPE